MPFYIVRCCIDTTLVVTSYKTTKMGDVEKVKKMIENVGGNISGVMLNIVFNLPFLISESISNTFLFSPANAIARLDS